MKNTLVALGLFAASISTGFAQQTTPVITPTTTIAPVAVPRPLPDSLRQQVHKLFKWGRLASTVGAVSGGLLIGGATSYAVRGDADWSTGINASVGTSAAVMGAMGLVRFSRKRERQLMAQLENGQPLPEDVAAWLPLLTQRGSRKK
ncbi:hypothetical protein SAMN06265337_2308 [Hymenobacter gelipurpurascens]|uniref:Transmembrane protein n=1 Tax=Hymenobacter gelipurpurascens TaxID=89968 RepID=A0A212TQZ3_9BACT|nr:hypothetical protein [Hymenobacter gelipurpurascens]SNC68425.1 hypothetical protein SAMN06265337_2308 [Hymenobacter gelipurpurascens]